MICEREEVQKVAYYGNEAYDFSLFEPRDYGTSAPAYAPEHDRRADRPRRDAQPDRRKKSNAVRKKQPVKKQHTTELPSHSPTGAGSFFEEVRRVAAKNSPSRAAVSQTRISAVKALKLISLAVTLCAMISSLIYCRVTIDNLGRQISTVDTAISEAKSEEVRLQTQLDSMISLDKVEDYAVNTLGMVKLENYKITYFSFCDSDKVVFSGDKEYK